MPRSLKWSLAVLLGLLPIGTVSAADSKQFLADNSAQLVQKGRPVRGAIGLARPVGRAAAGAARAVGRGVAGAGRVVKVGRRAGWLARGVGKAARGVGRAATGAAKIAKPFRPFKKRIIVP